MRIYRKAFLILFRSKILLITMLMTTFFMCWQAFSVYKIPVAVEPLGNAMTLSIYLFVIMLLVSFEYMKKLYNNGVAETISTTQKGKKQRNFIAFFGVLSTYSLLNSLLLGSIVLYEFNFYKIADPNNEYKLHIIKCIFLHTFLVMELAIIISTALAYFKKRLISYVIMTIIMMMSCPFATSIAMIMMQSCDGNFLPAKITFKIISFFYIVPRFDLAYLPSASFGESLLPDRIGIILLWTFIFCTVICFTRKRYKKLVPLTLILTISSFSFLQMPIAKMNYGKDTFYTGDPERLYCDKINNKDEPANYKITQYDMDLSLGFNLSAKVNMKVTKSLNEYKMTLHKNYKIKSVTDQNGNKLFFNQKNNYIDIKNKDNNNITNIILTYSGNTSGIYSNYQCCFLPAYFLYYPRAGYIPAIDKTYGFVYYNFVDKDTLFNVKVASPEKYISNLKLKNGIFTGKCDGFTLVKGFYKSKDLGNGNKMIYPYLDNFIEHDGKKTEEECWKKYFDLSKEQLEMGNVKDTILFFDESLSMDQGWAYGQKQYFFQSNPAFYVSIPH